MTRRHDIGDLLTVTRELAAEMHDWSERLQAAAARAEEQAQIVQQVAEEAEDHAVKMEREAQTGESDAGPDTEPGD
jgi:hypothetical protein